MFFIFLFAFLFLIALAFFCRAYFSIGRVFFFGLLSVFSAGFALFYSVTNYLTGDGVNEAAFYVLQTGFGGAGLSDFKKFIIAGIIYFILVLLSLWFVFAKSYKTVLGKKSYSILAFLFLFASILVNPAILDIYKFYNISLNSDAVLAAEQADWEKFNSATSSSVLSNTVDLALSGQFTTSTNFFHHYKKPILEKIGPNKNLVLIYLEGLEDTYSDPSLFPGLTPNLDFLKQRSIYFTNLRQTYGANSTIAGMVSSQCGIPLVSPSHTNTLSGMDKFLPLATCFGDLLREQGYFLSYFGGADLTFAGKGTFYRDHGFDETNGITELLPIVEDKEYKDGWGLYDDTIFNLSYNRFLQLSETKEKFVLLTLTVDTHHPNGRVARECGGIKYQDGKNTMLNAVACSDFLVGKFVNKILSSPYASSTVVVIASDHLGLGSVATKFLEEGDRKNRLMIISPDNVGSSIIPKNGTTLDTGATILPFIGYKTNLGLGKDLLSSEYSELESGVITDNIYNWRSSLTRFWYFPKIRNYVKIQSANQVVYIDERRFNYPILIQLDKDLQTALRFQFGAIKDLSLVSQFFSLKKDETFILVDNCEGLKKINPAAPDTGFCLLSGNRQKNNLTVLTSDYTLTVEQIKNLVDPQV